MVGNENVGLSDHQRKAKPAWRRVFKFTLILALIWPALFALMYVLEWIEQGFGCTDESVGTLCLTIGPGIGEFGGVLAVSLIAFLPLFAILLCVSLVVTLILFLIKSGSGNSQAINVTCIGWEDDGT